jgi:hypothetical protein
MLRSFRSTAPWALSPPRLRPSFTGVLFPKCWELARQGLGGFFKVKMVGASGTRHEGAREWGGGSTDAHAQKCPVPQHREKEMPWTPVGAWRVDMVGLIQPLEPSSLWR